MRLEDSIKRTIDYAENYGQELTEKQIWERLLGDEVWREKDVRYQLSDLRRIKRENNNRAYKSKIKKARDLAEIIGSKFKDILFIGVTGSVAAENPGKDDDIDLMIITKTNRLWLNRLKLRWFVWKNAIPHRQYGEQQRKDDFCFNLWLDESSLCLPKEKINEKNGVDMILMKPVYNKNETYEKFIRANDWVKKWAATPYTRIIHNFKYQTVKQNPLVLRTTRLNSAKRTFPFPRDNILFCWVVNILFYWPQKWWMRHKITNEVIDLHRAFFHRT